MSGLQDNLSSFIKATALRFLLFLSLAISCPSYSAIAGTLVWSSTSGFRRAKIDSDSLGPITDIQKESSTTSAFDIDLQSGRMYWSTSRAILSSNADGSDIQTHILETQLPNGSDSSRWISGLEIDQLNDVMYFADKRHNSIYKSDLHGKNIVTIIPEHGPPGNGNGISEVRIDLDAGHIYWTDNRLNQVRRANLDGTDSTTIIQTVNRPYGLALDLVNGKVYWTESGAMSQFGRIRRADLDGESIEMIVDSGLWFPLGLDVDPDANRLFWTDTWFAAGIPFHPATIQTSTLDGQNRQILADFGASHRVFALNFVIPEPESLTLLVVSIVAPLMRTCELRKWLCHR